MNTEMNINAKLVKELRTEKGWSQQHLADVCDISLRTIQRAEKTATASAETISALSSAFEIEREQLTNIHYKLVRKVTLGRLIALFSGILSLQLFLLLIMDAFTLKLVAGILFGDLAVFSFIWFLLPEDGRFKNRWVKSLPAKDPTKLGWQIAAITIILVQVATITAVQLTTPHAMERLLLSLAIADSAILVVAITVLALRKRLQKS